jgi:tellurite resistance protein
MTTTQSQADPPASFAAIYGATKHRQSVCTLGVLAWVASCDGRVAPREQALLDEIAEAVDDMEDLAAVEAAARMQRVDDLALACRHLRSNLDRGGKRLLLQIAITMAIADGALSVGENHLLQFLADVLGVRPRTFGRLFLEIAHRPFPKAGDPSSVAWWRRRESGQSAAPAADEVTSTDRSAEEREPEGPMSRAVALHVMGLEDGATPQQVHAAYRRLAKARHPDRFAPLGPAAVMVAGEAFKRLHEAYAVLSN